ncbi:MAG: DUF2059 domain-containing protein [Candidatus Acidiferrales bacterium]
MMRVRITLRMLVLSVASLAVFAVPGGLHAHEQDQSKPSAATPDHAAPAPAVDPAKRADILHLLDLMGMKTAIARMGPTLMAQMEQFSENDASSAQQKRLMQDTMARMQARIDSGAFEDLYVTIYDKYFTADDIHQLIQFYESPVGRKLVDKQADITSDALAGSIQWIQDEAAAIKADSESKPSSGPSQKEPQH